MTGDFVAIYNNINDAELRKIDKRARAQNKRTEKMMTDGEYGRIEALRRELLDERK